MDREMLNLNINNGLKHFCSQCFTFSHLYLVIQNINNQSIHTKYVKSILFIGFSWYKLLIMFGMYTFIIVLVIRLVYIYFYTQVTITVFLCPDGKIQK